MCGIAGQIQFDGGIKDHTRIKRMADALFHRGPDGEGFWHDGFAAVGHRRLSIRDLSDAGAQPMFDEHLAMVFNGQIYNDGALKEKLRKEFGVNFKGHCDAELIVPGFRAWGVKLFEKLEGIFSIALWDSKNKTLYLARDAAGVKPLFVHEDNAKLSFASEIKGILAGLDDVPVLSSSHLATFFTLGYVGPTQSLYEKIRQVKPGTVEIISKEKRDVIPFWNPQRNATRHDLKNSVSEFLELFSTVCHDQLVSDVPVGILQSGGVDSSLISLTLRDAPRPLFTASMQVGDYDETPFAAKIAAMTQHPMHCTDGGFKGDIEADFRKVVHHFDGQVADSSALSVYRLCRFVRQHVTVALSGDGADEHFAGYKTYGASMFAARVGNIIPKAIAEFFAQNIMALDKGYDETRYPLSQSLGRMVMALPHGIGAHARFRNYLMPWDRKRLFGAALYSENAQSEYDAQLKGNGSVLGRCLHADQTYYLPADMLWKADAMSMAHSLELRVPFLDKRIMGFAASLDDALLYEKQPKRILREALSTLGVSAELSQRPKAGFNVPVSTLLRGALRPLAETVFVKNACGFAPHLRPDGVRTLWQEHADKQRNHGYILWTLLTHGVHHGLG